MQAAEPGSVEQIACSPDSPKPARISSDPVAAGILKAKVRSARDGGATVIVTSHVIAELEELADDVLLLLDGAMRYEGTLARISAEAGEARLERAIASLMIAEAGRS